jgi:hypothetical protein
MGIDLVYTWVNAADQALHEERAAFAAREVKSDFAYRAGSARFRDNGELKYSLRSAELNLPFVRRIFVVHTGAAPDWLRPDERLVFLPQGAILPGHCSPNYQASVIEAFLHRIPGLSEHYVYANDDVFFSRLHEPGDFFDGDGRAIIGRDWRHLGTGLGIRSLYRKSEMRAARAARRLKPTKEHAAHPMSWRRRMMLMLNGAEALDTATHVAHPFRKSIWGGFHELFKPEVDAMCRYRFRSRKSLTLNLLAHHYAMTQGKATFADRPHGALHRGGSLENAMRFRKDVLNKVYSRFCLNDAPGIDEYDWGEYLQDLLNQCFPRPSRWEITTRIPARMQDARKTA